MATSSYCSVNLGVGVVGSKSKHQSQNQKQKQQQKHPFSLLFSSSQSAFPSLKNKPSLSLCSRPQALLSYPSHKYPSSLPHPEALKVMISGAPAYGKGTRCELVPKKVSGDVPKEEVFAQIEKALTKLIESSRAALGSLAA